MSALCFLDTNVLLYVHDAADERKRLIAGRLVLELGRRRSFVLSAQVLNEYYKVAISRPGQYERRAHYRDNVRRFRRACLAPYDIETMQTAWGLQDVTNYGWWDLMIVASAMRAGCRYLLTEDLRDGHQLGDLTIVNPFAADIDALVAKLEIGPPPTRNAGE
ncbi:MAG: PIN domain-containing protein [Caulobacteraceae bacterium]